jgi:serine/threonine protein kinase
VICYDWKQKVNTLGSLLDERVELLPTEVKSIAWQLTKLMLHCQELAISHLRLCPEAVVLTEEFVPGRPMFLRVKDFSMGKEFESVGEGKVLPFFEYLHPDLSVGNSTPHFDGSTPRYDIWSLGVILYQLVYKRSPFCKEGKRTFSKTILRKYLSGEYEVHYLSNKFASVNLFVGKCLGVSGAGFGSWGEVMEWMVNEEEIYNQLDFHDGHFEEMAEIHLRLMALFSGVYCMILDQCANSPHPFWRKPISATNRRPFHLKIA